MRDPSPLAPAGYALKAPSIRTSFPLKQHLLPTETCGFGSNMHMRCWQATGLSFAMIQSRRVPAKLPKKLQSLRSACITS